MRVFFSAGEASGDTYAAALVVHLESLAPGTVFEGVGGKRLAKTGARLVADSSDWGAIGVLMAATVFFRVRQGFLAARRQLAQGEPGLFVPIDFGFFNIRLAREAKRMGWHVAYFAPPGSWRRDRQGKDLARVTDLVVTQFPWSQEILARQGCVAYWFGHPLKELVGPLASGQKRFGVAVLPGSRKHEITANLPLAKEALAGLGGPVTIGVAPTVDRDWVRKMWPEAVLVDSAAAALSSAAAAVVCSGTATLEAALCHCPCVVVYRGNKLMELEARIRRPSEAFYSLPNIVLQKPALPELYLWQATPDAVRRALEPLLTESPERRAQEDYFAAMDEILGPSDALTATARLLVERFGA